MDQNIAKSILATICFFDLFDYPLTLVEIRKYLLAFGVFQLSFSALKEQLETAAWFKDKISHRDGFYFLSDREILVDIRRRRYAFGLKKIDLAIKAAKWIRFLPFVKMVALCNNIGSVNIKERSDIDLFIVVKQGRIFLSRLLVTAVVSWLGLRRHGSKIANRLCLSFYLADDDLNLEKIAVGGENVYLIYWLANIMPIYNRHIYDRLLAQNRWLLDRLPFWRPKKVSVDWLAADDFWSRFFRLAFEFLLTDGLGGLCERWAKRIQLWKMSFNKKSLAGFNDGRVVVSDRMLKFHENDRRLFYEEKFEQKMSLWL